MSEQTEQTDNEHEVTQLLIEWSRGKKDVLDELFPLIYEALRKIAHYHFYRERESHTLQTTALVHEAYLKMIDQQNVQWQNRAHFFAIASQAMRRILLDYARRGIAGKRGGGAEKIPFEDLENSVCATDENLVALDEALKVLADRDPQQARIVELRYFGGLTVEETAQVLEISPRTVHREWAMARAWLLRELEG